MGYNMVIYYSIDSWDAPPRMGLLHLEHKKKQLLSSTGKFNL